MWRVLLSCCSQQLKSYVAFCHRADPLSHPVLILTLIQLPLVWEMSITMTENCSSCWVFLTFSVIVKMENYSINRNCINNNEEAVFERCIFLYCLHGSKQFQNHLVLIITSPFSSCFNLTTKTSHNHVSPGIIRVHYWKRKHCRGKKPNPTTNQDKAPSSISIFKLCSYLAESCPRNKAILRSSICWPWTE